MKSQREIADEQLASGEITLTEHQKLVTLLSQNSGNVNHKPNSGDSGDSGDSEQNWFYEIDEQPIGPHSQRQIVDLIAKTTITEDTLLWHESMPDWLPMSETDFATKEQLSVTYNMCSACGSRSPDTAKFCLECGASMGAMSPSARITMPPSEHTNISRSQGPNQHGQSMMPATGHHASFWSRVGSIVIDTIVIVIAAMIFGFAWGYLFGIPGGTSEDVFTVIIYAISFTYFWIMEAASTQGTFGKMALGLKVVDEQGYRISAGKSFGRNLGKYLSGIIIIGYLMPLWTQRKQALHDKMSGTLVLKIQK